MEDKFDVIIVGAGVAGSAAAIKLAQAGLQVVVIERGPFPGSKNLSGGVLYGRVLTQLIPNYWEQAPIERYITDEVVTFMTGDSSFNIDYKTQSFSTPPYNGVSVLRSRFDRWLAEQAESAGAMLVPGIRVQRRRRDGVDGRYEPVHGARIRLNRSALCPEDPFFRCPSLRPRRCPAATSCCCR